MLNAGYKYQKKITSYAFWGQIYKGMNLWVDEEL